MKLHNIKSCSDENEEMMNANFKDPKLFSKLVNKKKVNSSGYTAMIKYEEEIFRGDEQVLSGFFKYHNLKSSPPEVYNCEDNH